MAFYLLVRFDKCNGSEGRCMNKRGFTLLEIVVVVGLLGLLTALGSLAVKKSIHNSRVKRAEAELEMISAAVLQMAWDTGRWPNLAIRTDPGSTKVLDLSDETAGLMNTAAPDDSIYPNWKGPYYEGSVEDPWGNKYFFDPEYDVGGSNRIVVASRGSGEGTPPNVLLDD
jgi:prepilin-type N-terminal cleavage/methylation domain-containing protein